MESVCIISPGGRSGVGGIQSYARAVAAELERRGASAPILDPRGPSAWLSPAYLAATAARMAWLRSRGVRVAHIQVSERMSFPRKWLVAEAAWALGMRVVLHHHGAEAIPWCREAAAPVRALVRRLVRRAEANVVLGEAWALFLREEMGVDPARIEVLGNALPDLRRPPRPDGRGPFRPLFLAVMSRRKGARIFLEALARLKAEGVDIEATLAGAGPDLAACKAEAARLGLAEACRFPGWVDAAARERLLAAADVYVLPSFHEGLPIAVLEALRAGAPVVATPVGALPEAVPEGEGIIYVQAGDAAGLAQALGALARGPDAARALGARGRELFERRFRMDAHMTRLERIYERDDDAPVAGPDATGAVAGAESRALEVAER